MESNINLENSNSITKNQINIFLNNDSSNNIGFNIMKQTMKKQDLLSIKEKLSELYTVQTNINITCGNNTNVNIICDEKTNINIAILYGSSIKKISNLNDNSANFQKDNKINCIKTNNKEKKLVLKR